TLPAIESHKVVDVGFKVGIAGTYSIQFTGTDSFDAFTPIYLEDIKENIFINLRENQSYTYDYNPGDETDRFKVHFAEPVDRNEGGI
ncbi:MAG: hypothetical protein K8R53_04550, partial [Bacteroidales bacterium]|nr:hypothetical protein [Bacteroidales bacterium]